MTRNTLAVVATVTLILTSACSTWTVRTDWDAEAEFNQYSTFAWFERGDRGQRGRAQPSPLVAKRVERRVVSTLTASGYREAPPRQADFLVTHHTAVREKVAVSHLGYAYPRRWHRGWGWGATRVHHYREGSLVIDVIDRRNRELVWRGVAQGAFTSPNPSDEKVQKVVERLLADFPPA